MKTPDLTDPRIRRRWIAVLAAVAAVLVLAGVGVDVNSLRPAWDALVNVTLAEATLVRPKEGGYIPRGKSGEHSEHLSFLLAEMQCVARSLPHASW